MPEAADPSHRLRQTANGEKNGHSSIAAIEKRAGIDFGRVVRDADTIQQADQPVVGREALQGQLITRLQDLKL
jgi:hypothetical protein